MKAVAVVLLLTAAAYAQTSPEEIAVKMAYSRLCYSNELRTVMSTVEMAKYKKTPLPLEELEKAIQENTLTINIEDWKMQSLAEFGQGRLNNLNLDPATNYVQVSGTGQGSTEGDPPILLWENEISAKWTLDSDIPVITVADRVHYVPDLYKWVRQVATYTVTASLKGSTRTSIAYALVGTDRIEIVDSLVDGVNNALASENKWVTEGNLLTAYPVMLLHSQIYDTEATRKYLQSAAAQHEYKVDLEKRLAMPIGITNPDNIQPAKGTPIHKEVPTSSVTPAASEQPGSNCHSWNSVENLTTAQKYVSNQHLTGGHWLGPYKVTNNCVYTPQYGTDICHVVASQSSVPYIGDTGTLTDIADIFTRYHMDSKAENNLGVVEIQPMGAIGLRLP